MNLNKTFILGRVTKDPEMRQTVSGQSVATFSVATNRVWMDKAGKKQEEVEFHNVTLWARSAEVAAQYLTKGQLVLVEGHLQTREWTDKQGVTRKSTDIVGESMQLGPKSQNTTSRPASNDDTPVVNLDEEEVNVEDLPF